MKTSTGMYAKGRSLRGGTLTREERVEMGRNGGKATVGRYGHEHMGRLAKKGGEALKLKRGREYFSELGKKGRASQLKKERPNETQCPECGGMGHGAAYCENGG